ncbi:MAG: trigger factor [Candidatus Saccharimonadales bacterium]
MQIAKKKLSDTQVELSIVADDEFLEKTKNHVLKDMAKNVSLAGFRKGHAPLHLIEKNVDQNLLQSQFIDHAVNDMYVAAVDQERVRPVAQPEVNVTKFVPFSTLEITAKVEAVGEIKLADYKKIKLSKTAATVTNEDVEGVISNLKTREATKNEVKRAAQDGDQVTIDFRGIDTHSGEPVNGADGKDYPLLLGSNTFIPGFEPELVGLKTGEEKTFDVAFPKDYGVAALQGKKVTFTVNVSKVEEVIEPKVDDKFAGKIGPFKTVSELKADIKKQLLVEKQNQADREYENSLLLKITEKTSAKLPATLIDEEIDRMEAEEKRNLMYRGQTWAEHLAEEGVSEEEHHERQRELATNRVKSGLVLAEVAEREQVIVTPEELDLRMQILKGQYTDPQMQAELNKPEARRDILNRLVSEKTLAKLVEYAAA